MEKKMNPELVAYEVVRLAQIHDHLGQMASSARLCRSDAVHLFNHGDYEGAVRRAVASLKYSVGMFSPVYVRAEALASGRAS